ncbi:hypothetical protein CLV45_3863 [Hymenobacter chitinivorans DSM 11115]|uniref:Uncharacterized protein n=1 Tax=Hymenobacter chitinivorans DSM 11115 TaxID=1121954 RepID=A0A2M9B5I2_9BACT|nr:hypothetical protein CLV45_3863 [Hymenobacter chitinivorans DSM 11115]
MVLAKTKIALAIGKNALAKTVLVLASTKTALASTIKICAKAVLVLVPGPRASSYTGFFLFDFRAAGRA